MFALVQENKREKAVDVKLASTLDELLMLNFQYDPHSYIPRVHVVEDRLCLGHRAHLLMKLIREQTLAKKFKRLRLP